MEADRHTNMDKTPAPQDLAKRLSRAPLLLFQLGWGPALDWLPLLSLTTRGRKTGQPRHTALEYRRHGSKLYVVSGAGEESDWYRNLQSDPRVTVQHGAQIYAATARRVEDDAEALRALYAFSRNSFVYEALFTRMSSANAADLNTLTEVAAEFTVVRIEPSEDEVELPPLEPFSPPVQQLATLVAVIMALRLLLVLLRAFSSGRR